MSNDLSNLQRVKPNYGKAQWVEAKHTGIDPDIAERTHTFGVPSLMPGTITFAYAAGIVHKAKADFRNEPLPRAARGPVHRGRWRRSAGRGKPWGLLAGGALAGASLLSGCGIAGMAGPYPGVPDVVNASSLPKPDGPVAAPQVGYRIDEKRYFEIVPRGAAACTGAMLYFVDESKGIRSEVVKFDDGTMLGNEFVIDAANEQYLVAPITRGNTDCSSGGGFCGGSKLPYSTDGGRTWKRAEALSPSDEIYLTGSTAYSIGDRRLASVVDLRASAIAMIDWKYMPQYALSPKTAPVDAKFHCTPNGKE